MLLIASQLQATPLVKWTEDPLLYDIRQGPDTICYNTSPGNIMGMNPGSPGTFTFQWQSSTTSSSAGFSNIVSADQRDYMPGNLTVTTWFRRITTASTGETYTSNVLTVVVLPHIINLIINNPASVCMPQTIDLTDPAVVAGSSAGLTYSFFNDAGATDPLLTPAAISSTVALNRNYYIKGADKCGNEAVAPVRVVINAVPALSVSGPASPVCRGTQVTLTATAAGSTVQWQGVGTGHNVAVEPNATTTYVAVATDANGCTASANAVVNVISFDMELTANPATVLSGNPVTLTASSNTLYTVNAWLPENIFSNQSATTQTIVATGTAHTLSVVGISEDGCRDTAKIVLNVSTNESDVFIPNAFTPNNDGKNDVFKVYGSSIKEVDIKIYNQWGNFVFETKDNILGWNGTQNGKHQPVGTYMYIIKIRLNNEDSFIKKGSFTLIR